MPVQRVSLSKTSPAVNRSHLVGFLTVSRKLSGERPDFELHRHG